MKGNVALITGSTSGIGRATALAFARKGAHVVVTGRREEQGEEVVKEIADAGSEGLFVQTDINSAEDIQHMVAAAMERFGRLDYAFNNAGIEGRPGPLVEQDEENYRQVFDANVRGVFLSMKYEIPAMLENGGGAIVNNSSIAGMIGMAGMGIYVASKHAVLGLTKAAALECAQQGVRINAVCPAAIQTEMYDRFVGEDPDAQEYMKSMHPIGRIGKASEVADAVVYLCSDEASFLVGHALAIDGGFTIQ
jgi:NAD(P)-dependent dehydrogenase (short-subunit alcohol dehydrogenase family)